MIFKKIRQKFFGKNEEEKNRELMKKSLMDSFETRPKLTDEEGNIYEDNDYVGDLIKNYNAVCEGEQKAEKPKTPFGDWLKFFGAAAAAGASIFGTIVSYRFAKECVESEKDGNIIPRNQFSYNKIIEKPKS